MKKRVVVRYRGHVQGVGFRVNAVQSARGLDVDGFVRNESDGSVFMDVQGDDAQVRALLERIESVMGRKIDETLIDVRDPTTKRPGFKITQ